MENEYICTGLNERLMLERKFAENLEKLAKFEGYYDDAKPVKI